MAKHFNILVIVCAELFFVDYSYVRNHPFSAGAKFS